jgi:N-carbamoyl-L-amino-acid hydrolase
MTATRPDPSVDLSELERDYVVKRELGKGGMGSVYLARHRTAGHDVAIMATVGIPSAMLFVRSDAGGVSHAPEESTGADAIALCAQALESALRELAA